MIRGQALASRRAGNLKNWVRTKWMCSKKASDESPRFKMMPLKTLDMSIGGWVWLLYLWVASERLQDDSCVKLYGYRVFTRKDAEAFCLRQSRGRLSRPVYTDPYQICCVWSRWEQWSCACVWRGLTQRDRIVDLVHHKEHEGLKYSSFFYTQFMSIGERKPVQGVRFMIHEDRILST